jgi:hypothetical protein
MAQKGADFLAIPVCRPCHTKFHDGTPKPSQAELFELIVIHLVCYLNEPPKHQPAEES